MKIKNVLLGMLVIFLAFGLTITSCGEGGGGYIGGDIIPPSALTPDLVTMPNVSGLISGLGGNLVATEEAAAELIENAFEALSSLMPSIQSNYSAGSYSASRNIIDTSDIDSGKIDMVFINEKSELDNQGTLNGYVKAQFSGNGTNFNGNANSKLRLDIDFFEEGITVKGAVTLDIFGSASYNGTTAGIFGNAAVKCALAVSDGTYKVGVEFNIKVSPNLVINADFDEETIDAQINEWVNNLNPQIDFSIYLSAGTTTYKDKDAFDRIWDLM